MKEVPTTRVFKTIQHAKDEGFTTVSEQGSSRSGKTFNTVLWLCQYCENNPNKIVSVVRATLPALKGSVLRDFKENMLNLELWDNKRFNKILY